MTPLKSPSSDKPASLPLLTELADGVALGELPTLTEIVDHSAIHTDFPNVATSIFDELPILLESAEITDPTFNTATPEVASNDQVQALLSEAQLQQLEQQLATHLETMLMDRLSLRLEQLQKVALEQTVEEFKTELPMLLRDALASHLKSR